MIKIVCFGKIKETYLLNAINDYLSRINKYHKIEIIELKDNDNILIEEQQVLKYLNGKSYNICLDIKGNKIDSIGLSNTIDNKLMNYGNICFFIGSSNGLSDKVKSLCDSSISFGDITMPHGLFRVVLLEQIYRSFKILNNESYHK